jgi:Tol biopolymer transport system component
LVLAAGIVAAMALQACSSSAPSHSESKSKADPVLSETKTKTERPGATTATSPSSSRPPEPQGLIFEGEKRLANVHQVTFGGQNAEAYWSADGSHLIYQWTPSDGTCDQIYTMKADGSDRTLVSTGKGRTTCSYYIPGTDRILFSSTHNASEACPPPPDHSQGYVWAIYSTYEIYTAQQDGSELKALTKNDAYDAEATLSVDGKWIVFTSTRDGDLDLYKMRIDGTDVTRLTEEPGYDGGAFFSRDGRKIVYRASRPEAGSALDEYKSLLAQGLVRPRQLEIYTMNADGTGKTRVTSNGAANFAPYFTPDGTQILFASNMGDPKGRNFDLYLVNVDGSGLEKVTTCTSFDGFPMFSPDGKKLAFASNRNGSVPGETNIFVADWVAKP